MKFIFSVLVILVSFCLFTTLAYASTDVLFVIDFSGSMDSSVNGEKQIDSARDALIDALDNVPEAAHVGLRLYGHRIPKERKNQSCKDTELLIPFAEHRRSQFTRAVYQHSPKGYTPIAYSLEQARDDFPRSREAQPVIILLSDGEETCGGDPVAVVNQLRADGFEVIVHTIGFNVDAATRSLLQNIARAGEGEYFDAQGSAQLRDALSTVTKQSFIIDKQKFEHKVLDVGTPIRGGDDFDSAIPIDFDIEYKLDHHQKQGFYDFFYLDLNAGDSISGTVRALEKGIEIHNDGSFEESDSLHGAVYIKSDKNVRIFKKELLYAKKFEEQQFTLQAEKTQRYFVLVGHPEHDIHKDGFTFRFSPTVDGLDKRFRGGTSRETAKPVPLGTEVFLDHHQHEDEFDYFYVDLDTRQQISLILHTHAIAGQFVGDGSFKEIPGEVRGNVALTDSAGRKIYRGSIERPQENIEYFFVPDKAGRYFVKIGGNIYDMHKDGFSFTVKLEEPDRLKDRAGGVDFTTAKPFAFGEELRLAHHQSKDRFDYFRIELDKTEFLKLKFNLGARGLTENFRDALMYVEEGRKAKAPAGGFFIYDSFEKELFSWKEQDRGLSQETDWHPPAAGTYYIVIGHPYYPIHREAFTFSVNAKDAEE